MDNNELIQQARGLCEGASTEKAKGNAVDSAALSWAIAQNIVPQLCDALEAMTARAEKSEAENRWIPVSERLPEKTGKCLVFCHEWSDGAFLPTYEDFTIRVMRFLDGKKWRYPVCVDKRCEADTHREVTHWRPLPEPPKG